MNRGWRLAGQFAYTALLVTVVAVRYGLIANELRREMKPYKATMRKAWKQMLKRRQPKPPKPAKVVTAARQLGR